MIGMLDLFRSERYCWLWTLFRGVGSEMQGGEVQPSFRKVPSSEVASRTFACERQFVSASQHLELDQLSLHFTNHDKLFSEATYYATSLQEQPTENSSSTQPPKCPAIIPISSCVARPAVSPSAASATNATVNAPSATPTCDPPPSCASATSAPSATTRTSASCAAVKESQTPSTASSARDWRRTEMGARRL